MAATPGQSVQRQVQLRSRSVIHQDERAVAVDAVFENHDNRPAENGFSE